MNTNDGFVSCRGTRAAAISKAGFARMAGNACKVIRWVLVFSMFAAGLPIAAHADRGGRGDRGDFRDRHHDRGAWRGDIRGFHGRHFKQWRGGHWVHGHHDGRLGWWWVAAGLWFLYPRAIYPYPDPYTPPVVVVPQAVPPVASAAPPQYWYYCEPAKAYYPYVASCPTEWKAVPATPDAAPAQ